MKQLMKAGEQIMKNWLTMFVFGLFAVGIAASATAGTPVVDGLFYGPSLTTGEKDVDNYDLFAEDPGFGAIYQKQVGDILYVAIVLQSNANDNVVGNNKLDGGYLSEMGWNNHNWKHLEKSDHVEVKLTCGSDSWTWYHGYLYDADGDSDPADKDFLSGPGDSSIGGGTPPDGTGGGPELLASASSMQWNMNHSLWDVTLGGTRTTDTTYKSLDSDYDGSAMDEGYPGYNATWKWEWSMVYEFAIDLGNCADQCHKIEFPSAHNSPAKVRDPNFQDFYDWGDAPDSYGTTLSNNGPRHKVDCGTCLVLGAIVDAEDDGQPTTGAVGDDNSGSDDEDGLLGVSALNPGSSATITVIGTAGAKLDAWMDFDGNGVFDADEQIATSVTLSGAAQAVSFTVPLDANLLNPPYIRLRVSSAGGLTPYGWAADGEVEDHQLTASIGNYYWEDGQESEADGIQGTSGNEQPLRNAKVELYTSADVFVADTLTDSSGQYLFSGLMPGSYYVKFILPDPQPNGTYEFVAKDQGSGVDQDKLDSDADTTSGKSQVVTLTAGEYNDTVDAGVTFVPTLVTLTDFGAVVRDGQVVVFWETSSEMGTIGFFLERLDRDSGEYVTVNDTIIPGALFSNDNNLYEVADAGVAPEGSLVYRLVEIENTGKRNSYGPFELAFANAETAELVEENETGSEIAGSTGSDVPSASAVAPELAVTAITAGSGHMILRWASSDGATYRVERGLSLNGVFETIAAGVPGTAPENTMALVDGAGSGFYRIIEE